MWSFNILTYKAMNTWGVTVNMVKAMLPKNDNVKVNIAKNAGLLLKGSKYASNKLRFRQTHF
jgi:hypothetical protein